MGQYDGNIISSKTRIAGAAPLAVSSPLAAATNALASGCKEGSCALWLRAYIVPLFRPRQDGSDNPRK